MQYICKQIKYNSIDGFLRNLACKVYEKSQIKQRSLTPSSCVKTLSFMHKETKR